MSSFYRKHGTNIIYMTHCIANGYRIRWNFLVTAFLKHNVVSSQAVKINMSVSFGTVTITTEGMFAFFAVESGDVLAHGKPLIRVYCYEIIPEGLVKLAYE